MHARFDGSLASRQQPRATMPCALGGVPEPQRADQRRPTPLESTRGHQLAVAERLRYELRPLLDLGALCGTSAGRGGQAPRPACEVAPAAAVLTGTAPRPGRPGRGVLGRGGRGKEPHVTLSALGLTAGTAGHCRAVVAASLGSPTVPAPASPATQSLPSAPLPLHTQRWTLRRRAIAQGPWVGRRASGFVTAHTTSDSC